MGEKNLYLYRGYRYDRETGLYYLQARYYNPEWGRFLNADNFGGDTGSLLSHNVFAYCMNNPVNLSDPSGHWIQVIFAVVSIAITIYDVYNSAKNIYNAYQQGGTSAAIKQAAQEVITYPTKKLKSAVSMAKKSDKLVKDITSIGAKGTVNSKVLDAMKNGAYKNPGVDCSEIAEDLYNAAGK